MNTCETLSTFCKDFFTGDNFQKGDILEWKEGMKHKRFKGPFIVVEVLESPSLYGGTDAGSPYFREPLDLKVGYIDEDDGCFLEAYVDSRRFQKA